MTFSTFSSKVRPETAPCSFCDGSGEYYDKPCMMCGGSGEIKLDEEDLYDYLNDSNDNQC